MKISLAILLVLLTWGCNSSKSLPGNGKTAMLTWKEKLTRFPGVIEPGIPAFQETTVIYKRKAKKAFEIRLGEPCVIVVAEKPEGWGYYQFPTVTALKDGSLHAEWSMHADAIESYGLNLVGSSISADKGKTWVRGLPDSSLILGYTLPNNDMIKVFDPKPVKVSDLKMPAPLGKTNFKYRKTNFTFYRLKDMPDGTNGVYLKG